MKHRGVLGDETILSGMIYDPMHLPKLIECHSTKTELCMQINKKKSLWGSAESQGGMQNVTK